MPYLAAYGDEESPGAAMLKSFNGSGMHVDSVVC